MQFNSKKFEWVRYCYKEDTAPTFDYTTPDSTSIGLKDSVRDLGVILSTDLSFSLHIERAVTTACQMFGWCLRSFRGRSSYLLITLFKSIVQPHLDYCSQLWSPTKQEQINRLEQVQRAMISKINDNRLKGLDYWQKLSCLQLYSQERRRERYQIILIWKISQCLVAGYGMNFSSCLSRTGRKVVPTALNFSAPAAVRNARASTLGVKGAKLFNMMPTSLRNSNHGDIAMFKNHLDIYLANIPDQPTTQGLARSAGSNSLLDQVPLYESNVNF